MCIDYAKYPIKFDVNRCYICMRNEHGGLYKENIGKIMIFFLFISERNVNLGTRIWYVTFQNFNLELQTK